MALAEAAEVLGVDKVAARHFLRQVQSIAGPVPYESIIETMRRHDCQEPKKLATILMQRQRDEAI